MCGHKILIQPNSLDVTLEMYFFTLNISLHISSKCSWEGKELRLIDHVQLKIKDLIRFFLEMKGYYRHERYRF
jgi:hypothetical protein